jgi:hypothetical protein
MDDGTHTKHREGKIGLASHVGLLQLHVGLLQFTISEERGRGYEVWSSDKRN